MKAVIIDTLKKVIWPWIKEEILPRLQERAIEIALWVIIQMDEQIRNWWNGFNNDRQNEAKSNEQAATEKAYNAETEAERDKYSAIADVWRTVAEQYRSENEKLNEQLAKVGKEAKEQVSLNIGKIDTNLSNSSGKLLLLMDGKNTQLPSIKE